MYADSYIQVYMSMIRCYLFYKKLNPRIVLGTDRFTYMSVYIIHLPVQLSV